MGKYISNCVLSLTISSLLLLYCGTRSACLTLLGVILHTKGSGALLVRNSRSVVVGGKLCWNAPDLAKPLVNETSGGTPLLLFGSTYGLMSKTARTLATISQTVASAKCLPGHILMPVSLRTSYGVKTVDYRYLLPKPYTISFGSTFALSPAGPISVLFVYRSGQKISGEGKLVSSFIIALSAKTMGGRSEFRTVYRISETGCTKDC